MATDCRRTGSNTSAHHSGHTQSSGCPQAAINQQFLNTNVFATAAVGMDSMPDV